MPWTIRNQNDEWCIYKADADGEPIGDTLGCHESETEAERQRAALYANVREIYRIDASASFKGTFPDVAIAPGVDVASLNGDNGEPFYVTVPIVPVIGQVSESGLVYDEGLANEIVQQIIDKRPGGNFGHMTGDESEVKFFHPKAYWIGAMVEDGSVWAKAFIPAGEAREHLRQLKSVGGRISTSIFGQGELENVEPGVHRLTDFELETIDFAPPERASLRYATPVFVTAEMAAPTGPSETAEEDTMPTKDEMIAELKAGDLPENLRSAIIEQHEKDTGASRRIAELEAKLEELTTTEDSRIAELETERNQYRLMNFRRSVKDRITEMTDWQVHGAANQTKLKALRETFRQHVESQLTDTDDFEQLEAAVKRTTTQLMPLAETMRDQLSGPPASVSGRVRDRVGKLEDTPEARMRARQEWGV